MIFFTKPLKTCVLLICLSFFGSCETGEVDENNDLELENLTFSKDLLLTNGGSCSTNVNFEDLVVETSWISGDKGDRDTFGACGVDNESWMDKATNGNFTFKCLAPDGHRTELKEEVGDESSLTKYKRMKFTAVYNNVPSHGVTIAQIHNRGTNVKRPWLRLYIDSDGKFKIKETETTPTQSTSTYSTYTGMAYSSGQLVDITIWTGVSGQENAKIRVDYNGARFEKSLVAAADWGSFMSDFYLKAGVYTEGEDKQAKVTYSEFEIIH